MSTIRKLVTIVMLLALLFVLLTVASANSPINIEKTTITATINPYEYGSSPEHIYVFLYHGYSPYFSVDIDTSMCAENRLYVYDAKRNALTEISSQQVTFYTCTRDALFFVTSAQEIYKADYTGQNIDYLYQCTQGTIDDLDNYLDILYFIEDDEHVVFLNYVTGTAQTVWSCSDLAWTFLLNPSELVAATVNEDYYVFDITTETALSISSIATTELITDAVVGSGESNISQRAYFSPSSILQENDISLPLPEYPVTLGDSDIYHQYNYTQPVSWFHHNKLEGCHLGGYESNCVEYTDTSECEGFARYAHDRYLHNVAPEETEYPTWFATYPCSGRYDFNTQQQVADFLNTLNTGDYIRYGQDDDATPENGVHSIVLVCKNENGIWAYECNQNYTGLKDGETLNGQPKSYYGCGIHLQYYSFKEILDRYQYVVYYIKHNYNESPVYDDATYHKVGCSHCVGYLRQKHDVASATILNTANHHATLNCCNGRTVVTTHTGTLTYSKYSTTQHKVSASCCSGYILQAHTFEQNHLNRYVCTGCGYARDLIIASV